MINVSKCKKVCLIYFEKAKYAFQHYSNSTLHRKIENWWTYLYLSVKNQLVLKRIDVKDQ